MARSPTVSVDSQAAFFNMPLSCGPKDSKWRVMKAPVFGEVALCLTHQLINKIENHQ